MHLFFRVSDWLDLTIGRVSELPLGGWSLFRYRVLENAEPCLGKRRPSIRMRRSWEDWDSSHVYISVGTSLLPPPYQSTNQRVPPCKKKRRTHPDELQLPLSCTQIYNEIPSSHSGHSGSCTGYAVFHHNRCGARAACRPPPASTSTLRARRRLDAKMHGIDLCQQDNRVQRVHGRLPLHSRQPLDRGLGRKLPPPAGGRRGLRVHGRDVPQLQLCGGD